MPAEPVTPLAAAAARKRAGAVDRAVRAMQAMDSAGEAITFQAVARTAGVSRQWLYEQPELRAEIERLRNRSTDGACGVPSSQRAGEASLRQRNRDLLDENAQLRSDNAQLKRELAVVYGQQRHPRDA
jgi:Family of unknown function (DUF6262)